MIDWATVIIPIDHEPIHEGQVISFDRDGVEEWSMHKRVLVEGTFSKKISIKSVGGDGKGNATHLYISGNPSKFLQGHNIFGSDDLIALVLDVFKVVTEKYQLNPTDIEWQRVKNGDYQINNVDINYMLSLGKRENVLSFIRALEFKSKTRHGRPTTKGGTLYFGKNSQRWSIKCYCKAEEIETKQGELPPELRGLGLEEWVQDKLRVELRLAKKELTKIGIEKAKDLTIKNVRMLFKKYVERIEMSEQMRLPANVIDQLPNRLRTTYTLWSEGHDLRNLMSEATFRRHRKELKVHGINIDLVPESIHQNNVVPLIRILEAKPASIPDWAFERNIIHHSAIGY